MKDSPLSLRTYETIAIGDELLTGRISDTNSTYVADALFACGLRLERETVIPDDTKEIQETLKEAATRASCVICFGGLGPTSDDKTAEAVAGLLECDLASHAESRARLETYYASRGRPVTPQALKQALYPAKAIPLLNSAGMAPGFSMKIGATQFFFLPGVPREMKAIFCDHILPAIKARNGEIRSRVWRCIGIWESDLQIQMDPIEKDLPPGAWLGYRTRFPENHLTLYARHDLPLETFESIAARIGTTLKPWSYTESHQELEELILEKLHSRGWSVALAESCTGGLATQRLTRVPGASRGVWGGIVTYQTDSKRRLLDVVLRSPEDAVSEDCTNKLAENLKSLSGCKVTAAITGYLGPGGGDEKNPLGTIHLAVSTNGKTSSKKITLPVRGRDEAQWGAATYLLHFLHEALR